MTLSFKKKIFEGNKIRKPGWFWFVGLGDSLRGEKGESAKIIVLQTFPPNQAFVSCCPPVIL
jgi:hypothetical protein